VPPATRLASIHIYPMKAARAVDLGESRVEPQGLAGDRRWLLVDENGRFVSQREEPSLAKITVTSDNHTINVASEGFPGCRVPVPPQAAELLRVRVWGDSFGAKGAGPEADQWFSAYLGRPVRLVYLDDPGRRPVDQDYGRPGDVVSFADGFPLLLTSTGSLDELGRWLTAEGEQEVPMTRFRPNVVVAGPPPWAEDRWRRIRIGPVPFRVVKPSGRCVVTTTDQLTGERERQPLKLLGQRRRFGKALVFGQNLIPDAGGVIRVGDPVEIIEAA
jgi:uncharacterized protein YcbX